MEASRRELLTAFALSGAALLAAPVNAAEPGKPGGVAKRLVRPLPFDPKKLKGLSDRLIVSHHDNNYAGAVNNLNKVEDELSRVNKDTPGFVVGGLRERELTFANSADLHELYFGNLGGTDKPTGAVQKAIADAPGGFPHWEELFRATAMSLAGGSGWVILDYELHSGELRTFWSGNHSQTRALGYPLLVLDMYEHAYQMDFGAAAAKYVDAFFANIEWQEVNRRYEKAQKASAALRA